MDHAAERLHTLTNRFARAEVSLKQFEDEFMPLMRHFLDGADEDDPEAGQVAAEIDDMLLGIGLGEESEAGLRTYCRSVSARREA